MALAPRSIYRLEGEGRWAWQHRIPPTPGLRYSITFRTLRDPGRRSWANVPHACGSACP